MMKVRAGLLLLAAAVMLASNTAHAQTACTTRPTLRQGSTGSAVRDLQTILNSRGWGPSTLVVDGIFGVATNSAVKRYQTMNFLDSDGIVGTNTWTSLCRAVPSCGSLSNPYPTAPRGTVARWNPITQFVVDKLTSCFPNQFSCSTYVSSSSTSDHPGNAADCFPGAAGTCVTRNGANYNDGSALAAWLVKHHIALKVNYVIWQNLIWSRSNPSWRSQDKTGCTNAHYDHVHISMLQP